MTRVTFVFTNPGHHLEMMEPVARVLQSKGTPFDFVSLCELRGFTTPSSVLGRRVARVIPVNRARQRVPFAEATPPRSKSRGWLRRLLCLAIWPRLRFLCRHSTTVVLPNDAAFPYDRIVDQLAARGVPVILMQEGLRFPLPVPAGGRPYGTGRVRAIAAWGKTAAEYFEGVGANPRIIHETGSPRLEGTDLPEVERSSASVTRAAGIVAPYLLLATNPIDDQGLVSHSQKLELYRQVIASLAQCGRERSLELVVKLHPREDEAEIASLVDDAARASTHVVRDVSPHALIAKAESVVIFNSTIGVEALFMGKSLACVEIPGVPPVLDLVESGVAASLSVNEDLTEKCRAFLGRTQSAPNSAQLVERHIGELEGAAIRVAELILKEAR